MAVSTVRVTEGSGPYLHTWTRSISSVDRLDQYIQHGEPVEATYSVWTGACLIGTANTHIVTLNSGASTYTRLVHLGLYLATGVGTALHQFQLWRTSSAPTGGTDVTPAPFDVADTASATSKYYNPATATATESVQLATFSAFVGPASLVSNATLVEWDFDRPRAKPLIIASGTTNGIALKNVSATSASVFAHLVFTETSYL